MTTEIKEYGGAYFPKDKALKKNIDLKPLAIAVKAATKAIAEAIIFGKLASERPEHIEHYFKVKIWEHRDGIPCPAFDVFTTEFFESAAIWDTEKGEPAARPAPDNNGNNTVTDTTSETKTLSVSGFSTCFRAASLALFGPVDEVTASQYNQIVDLSVDTESTPERENMEAIHHVPRVLALHPEKQLALMAHVAQTVKPAATWPERAKVMEKWLDTPAAKRNQVNLPSKETHTESGVTLGGGNATDRSPDMMHNLSTLRIEVAVAILSLYDEIDIYAIPNKFFVPAKAMAEAEQDPRFTAWWKQLRGTPGILDYSRAAIIALIKSAPEDIWLNPVKLREFINRELIESNHTKPDQKTIEIACSPKQRDINKSEDNAFQVQQTTDNKELPVVCPGRAAQLEKELNDAFAKDTASEQHTKIEKIGDGVFSVENLMANSAAKDQNINVPEDNRQAMTERQIEVLYALDDLLTGRTNVMAKEEAEGVVSCTGHLIPQIMPMLMDTIITTESCLSPAFSDEEIHDVATTILDAWSDNEAERLKIVTDAIVEYRSEPELPQPAVIDPPVITAKPKKADDHNPQQMVDVMHPTALTYQQQLTIAALHGLCANPVHGNALDDLPAIAADLAAGIIRLQEKCE